MPEQIEVVYENGVLRPMTPLAGRFREHQHLLVTVQENNKLQEGWLADADPSVRLEEVRRALAKIPGTLAQIIDEEREER